MSEFLENLKARMVESQKRFAAKQQQLAALQAEYQAVAQEFNAWQTLVNAETRKEQQAAASAASLPTGSPQVSVNQAATASPTPVVTPPEVNKTEIVRELLRQHSSGMTPSDIWKQVKTQMPHRPYLYSVLKRLKDRGDITLKRGKYFFKFPLKPEEAKEQGLVQ